MQVVNHETKLKVPRVSEHKSSRAYLIQYFDWMKSRNSRMSIRAWAKMMGLRNHSLLVLLMNGKRGVRHQHVDFLLRGLKIAETERRRFKVLVQADNILDEEERLTLLSRLSEREDFELNLEEFRLIANWIHFALLEMTELNGFRFDPAWIVAHLDPPITEAEIISAWDRLVRLGLIQEQKGKWKKTNRSLTTLGNVSNQAVRTYHHQMIELAKRAVDTQTIQERVLNSCVMTINQDQIPAAQKLILEFRKKMESLLELSGGDATYQLSVQFFRLTRNQESIKTLKGGK